MHYRTFVTYNIIGGLLWALGITLLGYFLGQVDFIANNLEITILSIVAISCVPVVIEVVKHRRSSKAENAASAEANAR
jgi:membrane-associated protein